MKIKRMTISSLLGIIAAMVLADFAWAADCGVIGGTKVPCSCGDTVVTSTTLSSVVDPVVSTNDNDFCAGDGLVINTAKVNLNLGGNIIRGSGLGVGVGIKIDGVNVDKVQIRNGGIKGFETGISTSTGSSTNESKILKIAVSSNLFFGISLAGNTNTVDTIDALTNGDTGLKVVGDGTTLLFIRASQNGNHGIDVIGNGTLLRSGQVNRNVGNGMQLVGDNNVLDHNLATKNFDGIVIVGDGDGSSATLELLKNKASDNDGHGISVTGNNHDIVVNQGIMNGEDGIAVAGTGNRLNGNKANDNGDDGLIVTGGGNINDGGNLGKKNGGAVQCQIDGQNC